jgi:hypothetical protein
MKNKTLIYSLNSFYNVCLMIFIKESNLVIKQTTKDIEKLIISYLMHSIKILYGI